MVRVGGITSGNGKLYHGGAMIHLQLHIRVFLSLVIENAQMFYYPDSTQIFLTFENLF